MPAEPASFYRAFEDRFRGSRETIQTRLSVYLPIIEPLKTLAPSPAVLDIGCGRGEWLQLVREAGFEGLGVDLDEDMLAAAREAGLTVRHADAIATMRELPDASQHVVSGFHIAEHLAFDDLRTVIAQALRVLHPGGLLILETPNPENLRVASLNFHLDPTHNRPLPPDLLGFLAEHSGFGRARILRLQEDAGLRGSPIASLIQVLSGVSPDYALVAQKAGDEALLARTAEALDGPPGLSLEALAEKFDATFARTAAMNDAFATVRHLVEGEVHRHIDIIDRLQRTNEAQETHLRAVLAELNETKARLAEAQGQIGTVRASLSWRLTKPLRAVSRLLRASG